MSLVLVPKATEGISVCVVSVSEVCYARTMFLRQKHAPSGAFIFVISSIQNQLFSYRLVG